MTHFTLPSGKAFFWDGSQFFCKADYSSPRLPELIQLTAMLEKSGDYDPDALAEYLEDVAGRDGLQLMAKDAHAVEWINKEGRFRRAMQVEELRRVLGRKGKMCTWCGTRISRRRSDTFCSENCQTSFFARCDPSYLRQLVEERDKRVCSECGMKATRWEMDHIIPVSKGGGLCELHMYQTLCIDCHNRKTARG